MERRDVLAHAWWEMVLAEADVAEVVEVSPGVTAWVDHDAMFALHQEAERLRNMSEDEEWKRPFNDFRRIFLNRDLAALRVLADGFRGRP